MTDTLTETPAARIINPNPGHCRTCGADLKALGLNPSRQYCDEHRPTQAPKRAKGKRMTPSQTKGPEPIRDALRDITETPQPKKPTVVATTKVLGKVVYYLFLALVMSVVSGDMTLNEAEQEQTAGELALSSEDAEAIARPLARFLTPTNFWQKTGPQIIANSDIVDAVVAAYNATSGLMRYQRERKRREAQMLPGNPSTNGYVPTRQPTLPDDVAPMSVNQTSPVAIPPSADVVNEDIIRGVRRLHGQPETG